MILQEEAVSRYFHFCIERHNIYIRKTVLQEPWPWTEDEILRTYRFTNLFRELDTGTIYCQKYIRDALAGHPELFFNVALYRSYNRISTHEFIGNFLVTYDMDCVLEMVRAYRDEGNPIVTGAHMLGTNTRGHDKVYQVFGRAAQFLWDNRRELEPKPGDTLKQAFDRLNGIVPGFGSFISYEVITDLRWTRLLQDASDIMTWANPGPGAKRGLNRILGLDVKTKKKDQVYIDCMETLLFKSLERMPSTSPRWEMREVEHSLCEFDKYERVRLGEGRPRMKYKPPKES